jgi:NTP pyrophosphatase (non-canonical NTP hydrolase)
MFATDTQPADSLQRTAVDSVKRRGFYDTVNPRAKDIAVMVLFLQSMVFVGQQARRLRESTHDQAICAVTENDSPLLHNAMLMAQMLRLQEEVGELAQEFLDGNTDASQIEAADVAIVIFQIAEVLGCDLDATIRAKLVADERRGRLHGGTS